jgi:molybdopterin-guanine dinucleotide biosynthesis protein A
MGTDKYCLVVEGQTLLERTVSVLGSIEGMEGIAIISGALPIKFDPLVIASPVQLAVDQWPGEGPLGGVVSGLRFIQRWLGEVSSSGQTVEEITRAFDVAVVSCDLPFLSADSLQHLFSRAEERAAVADPANCDVVVTVRGNRMQSLHAVYRLSSVDSLETVFLSGTRRMEEALAACRVAVLTDESDSSRDVDTPEEWRQVPNRG